MLKSLFGNTDSRRSGEALYFAAVAQARQPVFYSELSVPDTVDGRFDMIATHVFLILHRLKDGGEDTREISQALFDAMFGDMDRGLREMGAGDLGVGRRVKVMAQAFMGRVAAYEVSLNTSDGSLASAVLRNIFRGQEDNREAANSIARYMDAQSSALKSHPIEELLEGRIDFAAVSLPAAKDSREAEKS